MAVARPKPPPFRAAALSFLLAVAGCAGEDGNRGPPSPAAAAAGPPPGFSADTFTRQGLASGATATEAGCRALPDGLWAATGKGRRECLRHAAAGTGAAGTGGAGRTALVYVPGDPEGASYRFGNGKPQVDGASEHYETSPETRRAAAEALSAAMGGRPVVLLARPGMHGSSGDHARDRHTPDEVELVDNALTQLRRRHGFQDLALVGFSSGGAVVANLLPRRADIRCAVLASAPLDMAEFYRRHDGVVPDHYATRGDLADPVRAVSAIRPGGAAVFVLGDRQDRSVPASAWEAWVAAARRAGLRVHAAEVNGFDRPELGGGESRHLTTARGMEVASACAEGAPAERILHALRSDEPLLALRGRRLGHGEIRAAVAGRSLRGNEWHPRVDVSSFWGSGGELYYLDLRRGQRRIAELRWRVEGDRLCTTRHGCGEVLSDGRALHLVKGEPPRLSVTLLEDGPGARPAAAAAEPAPAPVAAAAGAVRLLVGFGLGSNNDWVARVVATRLSGAKSASGSKATPPGDACRTVANDVGRRPSVAPSGAARATASAAVAPARPGRFSTTTGRPSRSRSASAATRATQSLLLPRPKPTSRRTAPWAAGAGVGAGAGAASAAAGEAPGPSSSRVTARCGGSPAKTWRARPSARTSPQPWRVVQSLSPSRRQRSSAMRRSPRRRSR